MDRIEQSCHHYISRNKARRIFAELRDRHALAYTANAYYEPVHAQGFELGATGKLLKTLTVGAQVTYTETDILGTGEPLRNRPKWRASSTSTWRPHPKVRLDGQVLYVGRVFDSSIPTDDRTLAPYVRLDAAAVVRLHRRLELMIAVDNVLDARYEEAVGFPSPGVVVRGGIRLAL